MNDDNAIHIETLRPIQSKIVRSETDSILERWEFGQLLRTFKIGKQLPKGLRAKVTAEFGLEASEITRRMQLAERYGTRQEVEHACTTYGGSWRRIIRQELAKQPQAAADSGWGMRAKERVQRLVAEAVALPERREELVGMLEEALATLKQSEAAEAA
jgi:hypothetical protein